ncbi:MAG: hypothetical protein V3T86_11655 [Planctomycetota bacterium]
MIALWLFLLAATPQEDAMDAARELARAASAAPEETRAVLFQKTLDAYGAILKRWPKDRELIPKVRRRRAKVLQQLGKVREAIAEHDAVVTGRFSRYDRARALLEGAKIADKAGQAHVAALRCKQARERFGDEGSIISKALLLEAACFQKMSRPKQATRLYAELVDKHSDRAKEAVAAYDALALMEIDAGRLDRARRWLRRCAKRYEKRAARGDRWGLHVGRLLGDMKAPRALAEKSNASRKPCDADAGGDVAGGTTGRRRGS